jgi:hypothetical protein
MKQLIDNVIPEIDLENPLGDYIFKIEISPYKQIEEYFEDYKELISLKIRPITEFYNDYNKKFENAWFYNKNWIDINNYLKENFTHEKTGGVSRGFLDVYTVQGINFVSVLFDTGPEIIFDLSSFVTGSVFYKQILDLVRVVLTTLKNDNCKAISYELRAITTIEKEKFEKTIIQISDYPITSIECTITDIEELIKKTLYNIQYKKLGRKW